MNATQQKRTFLAAVAGVLIARLVSSVPWLAETISWLDGVFDEAGFAGVSALVVVQSVVIGAVILLYQRVVQALGDRWPKIEAFLLGSDARPEYTARHAPN